MNKRMIALGVAVAMAAAVGCGVVELSEVKTVEAADWDRFDFIDESRIYGMNRGVAFVDKETGVEYIFIFGANGRGGVTVLLNPDGTPKIAEGYETEVVE